MIFAQIFVTSFFALQWIIMYMYFTYTINDVRTIDQLSIVYFVFTLTNYCFSLNNVKSYYISMLTSDLFRKTFIKGIIKLLPRHVRAQFQGSQTNFSMATITRLRRGNAPQR
jgi:hypothetical protein